MSKTSSVELSLTHTSSDKLNKEDIAIELKEIKERLADKFKIDPKQLESLLESLDELSSFELGRFLIKNKSLSGYWTWYVIHDYKNHSINSPLEKFLVEKVPVILATRERFAIFQSLLKKYIKSNSVVCSLPCGIMADLLTLDLAAEIKNVHFVGIDLDSSTFEAAKRLAMQLKTGNSYEFIKRDAWQLNRDNEFDLITSNGLNIYEKDDNRVVALYQGMYQALKDQGYLICSALTPPPTLTENCEWDLTQVNKTDSAKAETIMKTTLDISWYNFRSSEQTIEQLREAGFRNIQIFWDRQKMFPSFLAQKLSS